MRNSDDPKYQLYGALYGIFCVVAIGAAIAFILYLVGVL